MTTKKAPDIAKYPQEGKCSLVENPWTGVQETETKQNSQKTPSLFPVNDSVTYVGFPFYLGSGLQMLILLR